MTKQHYAIMNDEARYYLGYDHTGIHWSLLPRTTFPSKRAAKTQLQLLVARGWLCGDMEIIRVRIRPQWNTAYLNDPNSPSQRRND